MTPLRQRMVDAMVTRGFAARTQESYVEAISRMARHYHRSPALLSKDEVSAYLLDMVSTRHLSYSTMNQAACAARFLYAKVLGFDPAAFHVPMAKAPARQPELLSRQEIAHLFACCAHPVYRMLLITLYATGLRVTEGSRLRIGDIDSAADRMSVRVSCGKGAKDRYTILSVSLLALLRSYCHTHGLHRASKNSEHWLFPNKQISAPHIRREHPTCLPKCPPMCRHHQRRRHPHPAPLLCHPLARRRHRPVHHQPLARSRPHQHHQPLSAPHQPAVPPARRR